MAVVSLRKVINPKSKSMNMAGWFTPFHRKREVLIVDIRIRQTLQTWPLQAWKQFFALWRVGCCITTNFSPQLPLDLNLFIIFIVSELENIFLKKKVFWEENILKPLLQNVGDQSVWNSFWLNCSVAVYKETAYLYVACTGSENSGLDRLESGEMRGRGALNCNHP